MRADPGEQVRLPSSRHEPDAAGYMPPMRFLPLLLALSLLPACTRRDRIKLETDLATTLITADQEKSLGKQLHAELVKQGVKFLEDEEVNAYVEGIAARLGDAVLRKDDLPKLKVYVIDDDKTVNAMATPGGYVYVYTGLLLAADDQAEVAGVVGHEIGHVVAHHSARQMMYAYGASTVLSFALGEKPTEIAQIGAQIAAQGFLLANSRSDETEADEAGLGMIQRAGWDPRGLPRFFRKLLDGGDTNDFTVWFSSHPTTESRIEDLRAKIREKNWESGETGEAEQKAIVARLKQ